MPGQARDKGDRARDAHAHGAASVFQVMSDNIKQQIALQKEQVAKLRDIVRYQEARVESMQVRSRRRMA